MKKFATILIIAMFIGFSFGMFLAAAYDVSQDITLGQAVAIVKGE